MGNRRARGGGLARLPPACRRRRRHAPKCPCLSHAHAHCLSATPPCCCRRHVACFVVLVRHCHCRKAGHVMLKGGRKRWWSKVVRRLVSFAKCRRCCIPPRTCASVTKQPKPKRNPPQMPQPSLIPASHACPRKSACCHAKCRHTCMHAARQSRRICQRKHAKAKAKCHGYRERCDIESEEKR